jgi:hypothetical protein
MTPNPLQRQSRMLQYKNTSVTWTPLPKGSFITRASERQRLVLQARTRILKAGWTAYKSFGLCCFNRPPAGTAESQAGQSIRLSSPPAARMTNRCQRRQSSGALSHGQFPFCMRAGVPGAFRQELGVQTGLRRAPLFEARTPIASHFFHLPLAVILRGSRESHVTVLDIQFI